MKSESELKRVETTTGMNGYPSNVCDAFIGFDNAEELNEYAEKNNMRVVRLFKRDGWQLFEREYVLEAEDEVITADDFGDDYISFESVRAIESEIQLYEEELKNDPEEEYASERIANLRDMLERYGSRLDGTIQLICSCSANYCGYEEYPTKSLDFYYDSKYTTYGVMEEAEE